MYFMKIMSMNEGTMNMGHTNAKAAYEGMELLINEMTETGALSDDTYRTGFCDLDELIGGLRKGNIYLVASKAGIGKTDFVLNLIHNITELNNIHTIFFSLKRTLRDMYIKILSMDTMINRDKMIKGDLSPKELNLLKYNPENGNTFCCWKYSIDFYHSYDFVSDNLLEICRTNNEGNLESILVIDDLELTQMNKKSMFENLVEIRSVARELNVPAIVLINVTKDIYFNERNYCHNFFPKELNKIRFLADIFLLLYRDDYYCKESERPGIMDVFVENVHTDSFVGHLDLAYIGTNGKIANIKSV